MTAFPATTIDFIRHGEPEGGRRYRGGRMDDPLSEKGWAQMWGAVGDKHPWQHVVTSPMRRCGEFARELGGRWRIPLTVEERFREVGFGVWEGKTSQEINGDDPLRIHHFRREPELWRPDGAEPLALFAERVGAAWEELLQRHEGSHILVVAHAGVIRMILSLVLGMPPRNLYRIQVGNAAVSRVKVEGSGAERLPLLEFHDGRL